MTIFMFSAYKYGRPVVGLVSSYFPKTPFYLYRNTSPLAKENPLHLIPYQPYSKKRGSEVNFNEYKDPHYPIITNFSIEELDSDSFKGKIDEVKNFFPDKFRGFRRLPPFLNLFCQVGLKTKKSDVLALYACFDFMPVSILPKVGDAVFVLNKDIWKYVQKGYFKGRNVVEIEHSFEYIETEHSLSKLVECVDVVATPCAFSSVIVRSAISRLVLMVSYSSFFREICDFFRLLFIDGGVKEFVEGSEVLEDVLLDEDLIVLVKGWTSLSKDVYGMKMKFDLNDDWLTLIKSKKEDRVVSDFSIPKEIVVKNQHGGLQFVNVSALRRGAIDRFLLVKVLTAGKILFEDGKSMITGQKSIIHNLRMSEFLVGDSSGCISFLARNEQVDILKPGMLVKLNKARTEYFDKLFLSVKGGTGSIEVVDNPGDFKVNVDKMIY